MPESVKRRGSSGPTTGATERSVARLSGSMAIAPGYPRTVAPAPLRSRSLGGAADRPPARMPAALVHGDRRTQRGEHEHGEHHPVRPRVGARHHQVGKARDEQAEGRQLHGKTTSHHMLPIAVFRTRQPSHGGLDGSNGG